MSTERAREIWRSIDHLPECARLQPFQDHYRCDCELEVRAITAALAERDDVVEECAKVAENIGRNWHSKAQGYRRNGNMGPYLGEPTGFSIAAAIRALKSKDLPPRDEWRTIESAPRDGREFIGYHLSTDGYSGDWYVLVSYSGDPEWPWEDGEGKHHPDFLTHWRPLPVPPKDRP